MERNKAQRLALEEQAARERGKTLPHYAARVSKRLSRPRRQRKLTPSKRG